MACLLLFCLLKVVIVCKGLFYNISVLLILLLPSGTVLKRRKLGFVTPTTG